MGCATGCSSCVEQQHAPPEDDSSVPQPPQLSSWAGCGAGAPPAQQSSAWPRVGPSGTERGSDASACMAHGQNPTMLARRASAERLARTRVEACIGALILPERGTKSQCRLFHRCEPPFEDGASEPALQVGNLRPKDHPKPLGVMVGPPRFELATSCTPRNPGRQTAFRPFSKLIVSKCLN